MIFISAPQCGQVSGKISNRRAIEWKRERCSRVSLAERKRPCAAQIVEILNGMLNARLATTLRKYKDHDPVLVPIHGLEGASENSIPVAVAARLTGYLDYDVDGSIVQTSRAGHTGVSAPFSYTCLARKTLTALRERYGDALETQAGDA